MDIARCPGVSTSPGNRLQLGVRRLWGSIPEGLDALARPPAQISQIAAKVPTAASVPFARQERKRMDNPHVSPRSWLTR